MNVLFLHSGQNVPSARFRALPFGRRLKQAGYRCKLAASFPEKYDHFPRIGFRPSQWLKRAVRAWHLTETYVRRFDPVIIDRELFDSDSVVWEDRIRCATRTLILDVDDGIFLRYPEKYQHLVRMADAVIAGNTAIAQYTQPLNEHITVIPTCIELDEYHVRPARSKGSTPVVGWIGTTGNVPFLNVCAAALRRLSESVSFELRVIAGERTPLEGVDLSGVNVRFIPWRGETEIEELSQFDVGLMPLPADQPWMKYKCGLKLLQYMAVGIPGVASPIGVNTEIVRSGENGFLAESWEDWENALGHLLTDDALRQRLGRAARRTVEERYSVAVHFPRFVATLKETVSRTSGRQPNSGPLAMQTATHE